MARYRFPPTARDFHLQALLDILLSQKSLHTTLDKQSWLGARLRGRTATQRSKKGSENVLGRVLGKGFSEGF